MLLLLLLLLLEAELLLLLLLLLLALEAYVVVVAVLAQHLSQPEASSVARGDHAWVPPQRTRGHHDELAVVVVNVADRHEIRLIPWFEDLEEERGRKSILHTLYFCISLALHDFLDPPPVCGYLGQTWETGFWRTLGAAPKRQTVFTHCDTTDNKFVS